MQRTIIRSEIADSVVLFSVNLLSALPYLFSRGFYSDDWAFQAALSHLSGRGIWTTFQEFSKLDAGVRPVQFAYLVLTYRAFGQNATPYHIFNSIILGIVTILLYLALRELGAGRWFGFTTALIFGVLPQYSTDRFWIASFQATLCMAFAFFGIYALSRSTRRGERHSKMWVLFAAMALILSILSYEVAFGLIVASLGMIGWRTYRDSRFLPRRSAKGLAGIAFTTVLLFLVGIIKIELQSRMALTPDLHLSGFLLSSGEYGWQAMVEALRFNLWTYGLHMPHVLSGLYQHSALSLAAAVPATMAAVLSTVYLWLYMEPSAFPSQRRCLWHIVLGFAVFGLGFVLFVGVPTLGFRTAGLDNRIAIASALGAAIVLVAMANLASSALKSPALRTRAFSLAIGLICGVNCLVVGGIAFFWSDAASRQAEILSTVAANVRSLSQGSVVLLDGICRYSGPAVVFETNWDSTGAIQLKLDSYTLKSDVVSPQIELQDRTVNTMTGENEGSFPYGDHLFVFNVKRQTLTNWPSKEAADNYLRAEYPDGNSGCPGDRPTVF